VATGATYPQAVEFWVEELEEKDEHSSLKAKLPS
jgi:hypothetical protein